MKPLILPILLLLAGCSLAEASDYVNPSDTLDWRDSSINWSNVVIDDSKLSFQQEPEIISIDRDYYDIESIVYTEKEIRVKLKEAK